MRDVLGRFAYLAVTFAAVSAVWVAAKHPPEPEPTYITPDGKVSEGPPSGSPYSRDTNGAEEVYMLADADRPMPQGPVAAATP